MNWGCKFAILPKVEFVDGVLEVRFPGLALDVNIVHVFQDQTLALATLQLH